MYMYKLKKKLYKSLYKLPYAHFNLYKKLTIFFFLFFSKSVYGQICPNIHLICL